MVRIRIFRHKDLLHGPAGRGIRATSKTRPDDDNFFNSPPSCGPCRPPALHGYVFNPWLGGFSAYNVQGLMPTPPILPRSYTRGSGGTRPGAFVPLAIQGAGILKRPGNPPQGNFLHGRSHSRGHGGRSWGTRGRKEKHLANLTKEALDADLDEWRMKDKKLSGSSLDADLDEYWKKKDEMEAELEEGEEVAKDSKPKAGETSSNSSRQEALKEDTSQLNGGKGMRSGKEIYLHGRKMWTEEKHPERI
ncbi:hypothetical protein R1flu_025460 [Riccia fluitans]|uniref:Chromatin target of PRMT1 protein C-terminal domain-containing protein n=1 Tax=Riccia fluitans TaxID=41844 RepID=A0ABD1Y1Z4_9MARC